MKTLYLECKMGISGDMFFGALLDLLPNPSDFIEQFNQLGIPHVKVSYEKKEKCGVYGTHVTVLANHREEESQDVAIKEHIHAHEHHTHEHHTHEHHTHEHHHPVHGHEGGHHHSTLSHIETIIDSLSMDEKIKEDAKAVYLMLAKAEASVHHTTIADIHFHEIGTLDAIADIVGGCMLVHTLKPDHIVASPVHVGSGHVHCAHGILPVPAPATAKLLEHVPFYSGQIDGELCTPTGAALLAYFADKFGPMPILSGVKTGYGLGTKDFAAANMLRAFYGNAYDELSVSQQSPISSNQESTGQGDFHITELRCTLDDMTPESIGYVQELLLDEGALDVLVIPVQMKKNRPGQLLCVSCKNQDEEKMAKLLFCHTTTAGIRRISYERHTLEYDFLKVNTAYGEIRVKHYFGFDCEKYKPEYEDVSAASKKHGVSFHTVFEAALVGLCQTI